MRKLTLAATQFACGVDSTRNLDKAEALVRRAAAEGAEVVLLQELFETPYFCKDQLAGLFALARPAAGNPIIARFASLARELGIVLPVSFFERANNAHYNSVMVIDADGSELGIYRKSHIPDGLGYQEKFYFNPGDTGLSRLVHRPWPHRGRHLLGPVVSRMRPQHGPPRRGGPALSHGHRLRAAGSHPRQPRPLAPGDARPCRGQSHAAGRLQSHRP